MVPHLGSGEPAAAAALPSPPGGAGVFQHPGGGVLAAAAECSREGSRPAVREPPQGSSERKSPIGARAEASLGGGASALACR